MRLILQYTDGDRCTYSYQNTLPVEYESAEALLVDFMEEAERACRSQNHGRFGSFVFLGHEFDIESFYCRIEPEYVRANPELKYVHTEHHTYLECPPDIMTLDQFFKNALQG